MNAASSPGTWSSQARAVIRMASKAAKPAVQDLRKAGRLAEAGLGAAGQRDLAQLVSPLLRVSAGGTRRAAGTPLTRPGCR